MRVDETEIVYGKDNPQIPMSLHRCGSLYFLFNYCDTENMLREIDREQAWDLLNITESMRTILRKSYPL